MTANWRNILVALIAPTLAVVAITAIARAPALDQAASVLVYLPWASLILAAILALLFGRYGSLLFVLVLLVLYILAGLAITAGQAVAIRDLVATSLGVVLLVLAIRPEPWHPAFVAAFSLGIFLAGAWLLEQGGLPLSQDVLTDLFPVHLSLPVSLPAALLLVLGTVIYLLRALIARSALPAGILTGTAAIIAALHYGDVRLTAELAWTIAGLAIASGHILEGHRMAYRDELTGLPGRRAVMEHLARLGRRYTVAMVDVDHFKDVNDSHGHEAGDQVLRYVAARLSERTKGSRTYRYGGEEFAVLFPGLALTEAQPLAEALRAAVADRPFALRSSGRVLAKRGRGGGHPVAVTVSLGLAQRRRGERADAVLERADAALYRAKQQGRNRVVVDTGGG